MKHWFKTFWEDAMADGPLVGFTFMALLVTALGFGGYALFVLGQSVGWRLFG